MPHLVEMVNYCYRDSGGVLDSFEAVVLPWKRIKRWRVEVVADIHNDQDYRHNTERTWLIELTAAVSMKLKEETEPDELHIYWIFAPLNACRYCESRVSPLSNREKLSI